MLNVLIAESEELELGGYEVIGVVGSAKEARELAAEDMRDREKKLEAGGDPGICPFVYKMFVCRLDGYSCKLEIQAVNAVRDCRWCAKTACTCEAEFDEGERQAAERSGK